MFESVAQDLRYALRGLRRNPAFSLTAILIIAAGVGASSAVFSVVDRLLFRSLPYPQADRLVSVGILHPILDGEFLMANDYLHLREQQTTPFSSLASWTGMADCDLTEESPMRLNCAQVDSWFLPTFGISPISGRDFTREEDRPNVPKVALISYGLWQSRYGGDPRVIGRRIPVDGERTEIVGVLPADFEMPTLARVDLIVPQAMALTQYKAGETGRPVRVFGRLKPGVSVQQAGAMLQPFFEEAFRWFPPFFRKSAHFIVRSLRDYEIQDVKLASWVLFAATLAILLIVCANVANLLLARSVSRQKEIAVRAALGAGRGRLIRQAFTESVLVSGLGGIFGCGFAWILLRGFKWLAPSAIPRLQDAAIDPRVLIFTVAITFACGVLFGLAPAFLSPAPEVLTGSRTVGRSRHDLRRLLTVAQIAVSLILIVNASLLVRSLANLEGVAPAMNTQHVLTADITVGNQRYPNAQRRQQFFDDLTNRLRALPGVSSVAVSDTVPPSGFVHNRPITVLHVVGRAAAAQPAEGMVDWRSISPDYFRALGVPILEGRAFREEETRSVDRTMILSASLARDLFPSRDALGQILHLMPAGPDFTVIGVAADVGNSGASERSDPEYYVLRKKITDPQEGASAGMLQRSMHIYDGDAFVIVRGSARPDVLANWIRTETAALDSTVPVSISTMQQRIRAVSERSRFSALLLTLFAAIGVILAASGLYGLIAFLVVQRTQEIGVRMALGATPAQIARLVLSDAMRWTILGIVAGLAGAAASARLLESILFHVSPENPPLFAAAAALLLAVAAMATLAPSLKASRIDPIEALRSE